MAQNIKMGKAKSSKKLSKEVRKENLPYYRNTNRRTTTTSTSHHSASVPQNSDIINVMSSSEEESLNSNMPSTSTSSSSNSQSSSSTTFRGSTASWNISTLCEENGVTPLPAEDEPGSHGISAPPAVAVSTVGQSEMSISSSYSVYTTLSTTTSTQRHVTPAVMRREPAVLDAPMAPRILGNSQRENCPRNHHQDADAASIFFAGMLTPPHKDDQRRNHQSVRKPEYFQHISEEVLLHIFSFLTRSSLARCMRVCRKWHRVGDDESLWKRVDLAQKNIKPNMLGQLVRRGTTHVRLAKADIKGKKVVDIYSRPEEGPRMSRLQYLDLSMASVSKEMLADILSHCKQLRKVSLENVPVNDIIFHLLSENTDLDTLNLSMCQGVTSSGLMPLFAHCKLLTQLNLAWTGMDRSCVSYACSAMPSSVRSLNISGCREAISDEDVENLCKQCANLTELDLSDSLRLTEVSVDIIRQNLHYLQCLSLSRCYCIMPNSIAMLNDMANLAALNVIGMMSREPIDHLQRSMPKILLNKTPFSTVARPTCGPRRSSIWEQRVREST